MLQQNRGSVKKVRIEAIRPFYKTDRDSDGSLSRAVIAPGDVIELPADVAADVVSCGKARVTDSPVGAAKLGKASKPADK